MITKLQEKCIPVVLKVQISRMWIGRESDAITITYGEYCDGWTFVIWNIKLQDVSIRKDTPISE